MHARFFDFCYSLKVSPFAILAKIFFRGGACNSVESPSGHSNLIDYIFLTFN